MKKKYVMIVASGFLRPDFRILYKIKSSISRTWAGPARIFWSSKGLERLNTRRHSVVILLFNSQSITGHEMDRLRKFIHAGGGAIFLNRAVSSQKESNIFSDIIGARYNQDRELSEFRFIPRDNDFLDKTKETRVNETFCEFTLQNEAVLCSEAVHSEGSTLPSSWVKTFGKGRVFCFLPGGRLSTYRNPDIWDHLRSGFNWVSERKS
ncbi:MAG: ThuA domain-containing protein [Spirochaetales bacterium]|nr:ThuA domain-containing protein [Spirochaetales bacterium]